MEKVLRSSDDGIIVYIAPTKALVSQIAAEVYARFSKDLNGSECYELFPQFMSLLIYWIIYTKGAAGLYIQGTIAFMIPRNAKFLLPSRKC